MSALGRKQLFMIDSYWPLSGDHGYKKPIQVE
jgi:hypothetical protein